MAERRRRGGHLRPGRDRGRARAETFATLDPEEFYDFQATRPTVRLVEGLRRIEWPAVELRAARLPAAEHDLIVVGARPNLRWRTFAAEIVELAADLRVEMVVTVQALLADVPHTRRCRWSARPATRTWPSTWPERLPLRGPTGILGVLGEAAPPRASPRSAGGPPCPTTSAWPPTWGAMALVKELRRLLPMAVDTSALAGQTEAFDAAVADLVEETRAGRLHRAAGGRQRRGGGGRGGSPASPTSPQRSWWPRSSVTCAIILAGRGIRKRYLRDHPGGYGSDGARSRHDQGGSSGMEPVVPSTGWGVTHLFFRVHPSRSPDPAQAGKELVAALDAFAAAGDDHQVEHQVLCASVLGLKADLGVMAVGPDLVRHEALARTLRAVARWSRRSRSCRSPRSRSTWRARRRPGPAPGPGGRGSRGPGGQGAGALAPACARTGCIPAAPQGGFFFLGEQDRDPTRWSTPVRPAGELMHGHGKVGRRYSGRVLQLVTGSTGLDDFGGASPCSPTTSATCTSTR